MYTFQLSQRRFWNYKHPMVLIRSRLDKVQDLPDLGRIHLYPTSITFRFFLVCLRSKNKKNQNHSINLLSKILHTAVYKFIQLDPKTILSGRFYSIKNVEPFISRSCYFILFYILILNLDMLSIKIHRKSLKNPRNLYNFLQYWRSLG